MKLKLTPDKFAQILSASGPVSVADIAALKAGISQLFKNGKNKIVFELPAQTPASFPDEILRELGTLDNLARELSGRVVVVCANPAMQMRIQSFAQPPLILCCATREEALQVFSPPPPLDSKSDTPTPAELALLPGAPGPTKEERLARELGDLAAIRKQLAAAEKENRLLHEQFARSVSDRQGSGDTAALQEKIQALEIEVNKLLHPS